MNRDDLKMIIWLIGIVGITMTIAFSGGKALIKAACLSEYKKFNPTYGLFAGCQIDWHGEHIPADMVMKIDVSK